MAGLNARWRVLLLGLPWLLTGAPLGAQALWELPAARGQVVLLGSIHFLSPDDYPLDPAVLAAFDAAEVLVMELDPAELEPAATAQLLRDLALDPAGRQLPELLGAEAWQQVSLLAGELGITPGMLEPWEPWYAALVVTQLQLARLGFSPEFGVESQLANRAAREGTPVRGLETIAGQLSALDTLPLPVQRRFLLDTLEQAGSVAEAVAVIVDGWKRGDLELLADELLADLREEPLLYQRLIVDRNRQFAAEIARLAGREGSYLVVVGALHLVGEDGVPALLESAGIPVRIRAPGAR